MKYTDPMSLEARQARIEGVRNREIAWRHRSYDHRTPHQKAAATRKRNAVKARQQAAWNEGLVTLAIVIILGIVLVVGL